jgi:hypothetical protein
MSGIIVENSVMEITLAPEGEMLGGIAGRIIVIRNPVFNDWLCGVLSGASTAGYCYVLLFAHINSNCHIPYTC